MVQDIRDAQSTEQIVKILNDRISSGLRRRSLPPPAYTGTPVSPFDGVGPTTTLSANTDNRAATVSIPDPGYPYKIEVAAGVFLQGLSTSAASGASHSLAVRVDAATPLAPSAAPTTGAFASNFIGQMGGAAGAFSYATIPRRLSPAVWTGAHVVDLFIRAGSASSVVVPIPLANRSDFFFDVRVVPATT
jgi:hypothetical protein